MKQTINCGLIGVGRIGEIHAMHTLQLGGKLTHVFDIDHHAAQRLADKISATVCTLDELLASDVDAVIIASPTATHQPPR